MSNEECLGGSCEFGQSLVLLLWTIDLPAITMEVLPHRVLKVQRATTSQLPAIGSNIHKLSLQVDTEVWSSSLASNPGSLSYNIINKFSKHIMYNF